MHFCGDSSDLLPSPILSRMFMQLISQVLGTVAVENVTASKRMLTKLVYIKISRLILVVLTQTTRFSTNSKPFVCYAMCCFVLQIIVFETTFTNKVFNLSYKNKQCNLKPTTKELYLSFYKQGA